MSFLAGRLAGTEGAFFAQQSKIAAARLREKLGDADFPSTSAAQKIGNNSESKADVLPEILSHSMPPYTYSGQDVSASSSLSMQSSLSSVPSLSTRGKGGGGSDHLGGYHDPNVMNPLNAWVSLPRATFGPKRWTLPSKESSFQASTANELRQELNDSVDTEKMKAAMEDFSTIGKAFAIATGIIFGGTILVGTILTAKLQLHTRDDIKREGKILIQPKAEVIKEQFKPVKTWSLKCISHSLRQGKRSIALSFKSQDISKSKHSKHCLQSSISSLVSSPKRVEFSYDSCGGQSDDVLSHLSDLKVVLCQNVMWQASCIIAKHVSKKIKPSFIKKQDQA